jgi:hypothetical protein
MMLISFFISTSVEIKLRVIPHLTSCDKGTRGPFSALLKK